LYSQFISGERETKFAPRKKRFTSALDVEGRRLVGDDEIREVKKLRKRKVRRSRD